MKLIVAITRENFRAMWPVWKSKGVWVRLGQHQGLQHSIWQFYLLYNDLSPRVLMFIKNSFQGVVPAMSLHDNHMKLIVASTRVLQGKQRQGLSLEGPCKDAVDAEAECTASYRGICMDQKGTKRIRAVNDGQKETKRTRAVNDGDTATIPPKGRVDVNVTDKAAATQLLSAARDGHIATVRRLVTKGHVDVNVTDENGVTPLVIASHNGHLEIVKSLIEAGANVNHTTKDGVTPLVIASLKGHLDIVKSLIEAGTNVNHTTKDGVTPLVIASQNGHLEIVKSLIEAGANVNHTTKVV
ncbi:hypothetical protein EMCRGX_G006455 [Ephydatia muelleri]